MFEGPQKKLAAAPACRQAGLADPKVPLISMSFNKFPPISLSLSPLLTTNY
jgi:hypothetical protein